MKKPDSGFTVIEIIVTITVIGILLGVVVVGATSFQNRSKKTDAVSTAEEVKLKLSTYYQKHNRYPSTQSTVTTYLQSIRAETLATKFSDTSIYSYSATAGDGTACVESGGVICEKYVITIDKSAWKGTTSDTNVTVTP